MSINFAVRSEIGLIRKNNEDNFFCNGIFMTADERDKPFFMAGFTERPCMFAVCDGMGGMDCGEFASITAVETLKEYREKILNASNEYEEITNFANDVNQKLFSFCKKQNLISGTTLALVIIEGNSFIAYNLGDSRIYRTHDGKLLRVTEDHTVAEEKVRMGLLTPKQAEKSRERNMLTRCLSISIDKFAAMPDINGPYYFKPDEKILICSDGLTDMLSHKEINDIMTKNQDNREIINNLFEAALNAGGYDNITCIVISA